MGEFMGEIYSMERIPEIGWFFVTRKLTNKKLTPKLFMNKRTNKITVLRVVQLTRTTISRLGRIIKIVMNTRNNGIF